jgi:predicted AlkP superfamily phosphohydrolase/phosphomutase
MEVYHGSYTKIDKIDLAKGQLNRDFGQGFYVTKFRKHAESWAEIIGGKYETQGFVTEFTYYDTAFTERLCKVKHFEKYDEEWLDFIVLNRNPFSPIPAHDYDIVEGPVADDKVQFRLTKYLQGQIEKSAFLKELTYHETTHQICFCTMRALLCLDHNDKTFALKIADISETILSTLIIDKKSDEETVSNLFYNSDIFAQLSNETSKLYKKSWQEIYEMLKLELKK